MRQFVVVGHEAPTTPEFALDDLAGAGRLDVLCRCVGAALFLSHDIREDTRVHLLVGGFAIRFDGGRLRGGRPDERSIAGLVRAALADAEGAVGHQPVESSPGVTVRRLDLAAVLADAGGEAVELAADGTPAVEATVPENPTFVLSDHRPFDDGERELLADRAARVSLGPERLHADSAIAVAHNYLDTDGYRRY